MLSEWLLIWQMNCLFTSQPRYGDKNGKGGKKVLVIESRERKEVKKKTMRRCIIVCAILVMALTTQAYGMGGGHGHAPGPGNDGIYGAGNFSYNPPPGQNDGDCGRPPVSVPEPASMLLLGAGLVSLYGLKKKIE